MRAVVRSWLIRVRPGATREADRPAPGGIPAARAWLIRGLILAGVATLAVAGWVATTWVSPERVRAQVLAALAEQFEGVEAHVGSARMRILGGIAVRDLKLVRRGDPADRPFLVVPVAVLFHDKEQLNRGRLVIRKIELENPAFNLERGADGRWNVADVVRPGPADRPVPTFVARGATLTVTDHSPEALPAVKLTDARLTLLNDPLPVLTLHAQGAADLFGPVEVRARVNRISRQAAVELKLAALPLGDLAPALAERYAPAAAPHLGKLAAAAAVRADLMFNPEQAPAWRHDVLVEVKDGRLEHPDLPWPAEKIAVKVRSTDGRVKVEEATAKVGPAHVRVALETREPGSPPPPAAAPPDAGDPLAAFEEHVQKADVSVAGVPLDDALFARLGKAGAAVKRMFSPAGTVDLGYRFTREAPAWKRELEVRPRGVTASYEKFRYPVTAVEGSVKRTLTAGGEPSTVVDVRGKAAGETVTVKGQVYGRGDDPGISLRVAGSNIPIDEKVIAALPDEYPDVIRQFRPTGRASFTADINQKYGVNLAENEFRIDVADGTINYVLFPLRFERVKGKVVVRVAAVEPRPGAVPPPDRDEFVLDGFTATHGPGTVWLNGAKRTVPGTADRKLDLHVGGTGCPVDGDLKAALAALKLDEVWTSFAPRGTLAFSADVEVMDRAPPPGAPPPAKGAAAFDPASDLSLTFNFYGPAVTPSFFRYDLSDLSGWLQYRAGRVDLRHVAARHGESRVRLDAGEVRFYPKGVVWANLGKLEVKNLVADDALLTALPASLRGGVEGLKLRGRADLEVKHLVVLTPPEAPTGVAAPPPEPSPLARAQAPAAPPAGAGPSLAPPPPPDPIVYWDAELRLAGASVDTGVGWEEVFGAIACRGRYEGTHLGLVRGNVYLDRAVIARQPVGTIQGRLQVLPQLPDPARPGYYQPPTAEFLNLTGTLFHGTVGGEARVVLAEPARYDLWLTATDVQLEEVARHYRLNRPGSDADLTGMAQAQVRLFNRYDPRTNQWALEGTGRMDVPTGRMYNLPVLLDLMKVLKLQTPDRTAFEEAHAAFRLKGERVYVDQLDLIGKAVCVGGAGELDISGDNLRLEFYTLGSQILARLVNTPVGDLSAFLSRNLFVIRMTKENGGEIRYRPEPVPLVTEPARAVVERLRRLREARP
ncbi:hypothetical protein J0H58_25710 [bacterium]|nr:hypothetical protein [bacterium]